MYNSHIFCNKTRDPNIPTLFQGQEYLGCKITPFVRYYSVFLFFYQIHTTLLSINHIFRYLPGRQNPSPQSPKDRLLYRKRVSGLISLPCPSRRSLVVVSSTFLQESVEKVALRTKDTSQCRQDRAISYVSR